MNTGGPAFPIAASTGDPRDGVYFQNGMTLLDWYAGQAFVGLLSKLPVIDQAEQFGIKVDDKLAYNREVAGSCYDLAEAMLAEKARRENPPTERISIGSDDQRKALDALRLIQDIDRPEFAAVRLAIANLASRFVVSGEAVVQQPSTTDHSEDSLEKVAKLEAANRELVEAFGRFVDYVSRVNGVAVFQEPLFAEMRTILAKHKGAA